MEQDYDWIERALSLGAGALRACLVHGLPTDLVTPLMGTYDNGITVTFSNF